MEVPKSRILVVDDEPDNVALLAQRLVTSGYEVVGARNGKEALDKAREAPPDLILADWIMPQMDGLELCKAVHADPSLRYAYFILMTAHMEIEDKVVGLESGADQYLYKPFSSTELLSLVKAGLRIAAEQKKTLALATTDGLTGLLNARAFRACLEDEVHTAKAPLSLLMIDINGFKQINDAKGHVEGDNVLKAVASFLRKDLRSGDYLARLGGDEFGIILHGADAGISEMVTGRIRLRAEKAPGVLPGSGIPISFSIGRATYDPSSPQRIDAFIKRADESMYVEKGAFKEAVRGATDVEPLPRRGRILIAEDDPAVRSFLVETLGGGLYEVSAAGSGAKAIQLAKQKTPDVVLVDWVMPEMDGLELCRALRAEPRFKSLYIIVITVKSGIDQVVEALNAGADEFLVKPVDARELLARIRVGLRIVHLSNTLEVQNILLRKAIER